MKTIIPSSSGTTNYSSDAEPSAVRVAASLGYKDDLQFPAGGNTHFSHLDLPRVDYQSSSSSRMERLDFEL